MPPRLPNQLPNRRRSHLNCPWLPRGSVAFRVEGPSKMADPILTAIANHALALEAMNAGLELRNSFETDDPRWIENEKNVSGLFDFEADAALELISIEPTTFDGAAKLIQYVSDLEARGHRWPD